MARLVEEKLFQKAQGKLLREVRQSIGFTLVGVREQSNREFMPASLSAYERGERAISIYRLIGLWEFYREWAWIKRGRLIDLSDLIPTIANIMEEVNAQQN